ncbi:MAG: hypothetical protein Q7T86_13090 [Hyphomicrobiaceae bacterium]|nr:hypothetical protein [Hyphomicrobiaceae bacterium]
MTKIVVANLKPKAGRRAKSASITEKRVRDEHGQLRTIRLLDPNSQSFSDDLLYVFRRNVAKARKRNQSLIGAPDFAIAKR